MHLYDTSKIRRLLRESTARREQQRNLHRLRPLPGLFLSDFLGLLRESTASKDLSGEPIEEHAEDDGPSQGSGLESEKKCRKSHKGLGVEKIQAPHLSRHEELGEYESTQNGNGNEVQPFHKPLGQFSLRKEEKRKPAREISHDPHSHQQEKVFRTGRHGASAFARFAST